MMRRLCDLITARGPISVAQYMAEALGHPDYGYYTTRVPFGARGDFVTAPEISQMFGELIGAWSADVWHQMGRPQTFLLVELGPGRGTLMSDALRATRSVEGFVDAAGVHLVEISPVLREQQAKTLAAYDPDWHASFDRVPDGPLIVIANELFDALPVHQFQFTSEGWCERLIDVDADGTGLHFVLAPPTDRAPPGATGTPEKLSDDAIYEHCPSGDVLVETIGRRIEANGGAALIIDYGYDKPGYGDTVQALKDHAPVDVLAAPGEADLCAHVDFVALHDSVRGANVTPWGPVTQGHFLKAIGIDARAKTLKAAAPDASGEIDDDLRRLTAPDQMGSLFKVLALTSAGLLPAGFTA